MSSGGHIGHQLRMKYYVMQWSYWIFGNISKSNPAPLTLLQRGVCQLFPTKTFQEFAIFLNLATHFETQFLKINIVIS